MALYEHMLIARQDISAQAVDALATHLKTIVETEGGRVEKQEYWGLRTLAFRIKKNRKGHYVLLNLNAPSKAIFELERQLKINEDVLRFLTVRVEGFEQSNSSRKRERDDRDRPRPAGPMTLPAKKERRNERSTSDGPPAVLPPPQDLPVLRRQRAQDRLQGRQAAPALHLGARQDRAVAHHRGLAARSSANCPRRSSARASWRSFPTS